MLLYPLVLSSLALILFEPAHKLRYVSFDQADRAEAINIVNVIRDQGISVYSQLDEGNFTTEHAVQAITKCKAMVACISDTYAINPHDTTRMVNEPSQVAPELIGF